MISFKKKAAVAAVGVVATLGIGGVAWAVESGSTSTSGQVPSAASLLNSSSASTPTTAGGAGTKAARAKKLLARTDHASLEVRVKGKWVTYDLDRGKATTVSPSSITLLRPDGQSVTEAVTPSTKFQGASSESSVVVGRPAAIISLNGDALRVRQAAGSTGTGSSIGGGASTGD